MEEKIELTEEEKEIEREVIRTIDKLRPYVQHDGGDIKYLYMKDRVVHLCFLGACAGCYLAQDDFNSGIQNFLLDEVVGIEGVVLEEPSLEDLRSAWL